MPTTTERPDNPLISLVIPCKNEEATIPVFLAEVDRVLKGHHLELVFVNDGSSDRTFDIIMEQVAQDERIRLVNLSRNFGKECALTAGLDFATGDVVIPIDVDLQDPLEVIDAFLEKWREGFDVVYGVRTDRQIDSMAKRKTAEWFYDIFNAMADHPIPANVGDFRLLDRKVVEAIGKFTERNRFMKGLFSWVGFKSVGVPYTRADRSAGHTKFNFLQLWQFAIDGIVGFTSVPLKVWSYVGGGVAFAAMLMALWVIFNTLIYGRDVPGYASLLTAILFFGGVQLITLGVIGEYLAQLFTEVKHRPIYIVDEVYPEKSGMHVRS